MTAAERVGVGLGYCRGRRKERDARRVSGPQRRNGDYGQLPGLRLAILEDRNTRARELLVRRSSEIQLHDR